MMGGTVKMRLEELKKGFWGYKREGVFQYITDLEETCSRKLQERDERAEQAARQAQARVQALEQENRALREELEKLRARQDQISQAILDARDSAAAMRAESQAREEAAREEIRQTLEADLAELGRYRERITALRETIRRTLESLEQQAGALEEQAEALNAASPAGNLTLFQ